MVRAGHVASMKVDVEVVRHFVYVVFQMAEPVHNIYKSGVNSGT